jgi:hypothetical protein
MPFEQAPDLPSGLDLENANGPDYLTKWNAYWNWTKTDAFKSDMRRLVMTDDFSPATTFPASCAFPITLLGINACSPLATNAIAGNIWDNFSSQSYKQLPSAGSIKVRHPVTGAEYDYPLPAGGRGYIRPRRSSASGQPRRFCRTTRSATSSGVRRRCADALVRRLDRADAVAGKRQKDPLFANENRTRRRHHRSHQRSDSYLEASPMAISPIT